MVDLILSVLPASAVQSELLMYSVLHLISWLHQQFICIDYWRRWCQHSWSMTREISDVICWPNPRARRAGSWSSLQHWSVMLEYELSCHWSDPACPPVKYFESLSIAKCSGHSQSVGENHCVRLKTMYTTDRSLQALAKWKILRKTNLATLDAVAYCIVSEWN